MIFYQLDCFCQNQNNNWYFGDAALKFPGGIPEAVTTSGMSQYEGSAAVSTPEGELLFYTSGVDVFDKENNVMANGTMLQGDYSSSNSAVIVPKPGNPNLYYIFTTEANFPLTGLYYSLVDMCLNDGLGDVVVSEKNVFLIGKTPEKVTTALHANGTDIWVITHGWDNNEFYAFLVTPDGVSPDPVITAIGPEHGTDFYMSVGCMKASQQNDKLALAVEISGNRIELYDFDNATGVLSNALEIPTPHSSTSGDNTTIYGIEFSPDGNFIYTGSWFDDRIFQLDITSDDEDIIAASAIAIGDSHSCCIGALQLGPDNKIYVATQFENSLGVINEPNAAGLACDYDDEGVSLGGKFVYAGLTASCVTAQQSVPSYAPNISYSGNCVYDPVSFNYTALSEYDSVSWSFGDIASADNVSTEISPEHIYSTAGNYTVELIYFIGCFADTISTELTIDESNGVISLPADTTICLEDASSYILSVADTALNDILWSTGDTSSTITVTESGTYSIVALNSCGTEFTDAITVTFDSCRIVDPVPADCRLYMPNAFTPNQDGMNDAFSPVIITGCAPEFYSLHIYNRWGEKLFESSDINIAWDGRYLDTEQEMGSYAFVLQYNFAGETALLKKGSVLLIR